VSTATETSPHDTGSHELTRDLSKYRQDRPKDYTGRHRVKAGEKSTMERLAEAAQLRADASAAITEAVA
jgi:hypothetical protein